jgi:hypothetical protein
MPELSRFFGIIIHMYMEVGGHPITRRTFMHIIDFEPMLAGKLFRDPAIFNQVRIDPEAHTLVWPDGADFDPATLHDWPQHAEALKERARKWQAAPV